MNSIKEPKESFEDIELNSIRPSLLKDYIGQERIKNNLSIFIKAARHRNEVLDHVLLYGPPGLGKTTLANIIANEMNSKIFTIAGPSLEKTGDIITVLASINPGEIMFIDEIHRIPKCVEEVLYGAMEDFKVSVPIKKDSGTSFMTLDVAPFTLIGATTRAGDLSSPLRDRFGISEKLNYYTAEEIKLIIRRSANILNSSLDEDSLNALSKRCRGTPRIANRLLRRVRDFSECKNHESITKLDVQKALVSLRIDACGLDEVDVNYLLTIFKRFNCGPVGIENIASSIGEEPTNLEEVCEPFLLQMGFINRTPKGRVLTPKGVAHLKKYHKSQFENRF